MTTTLVTPEYQGLVHPARRPNQGEWRDVAAAGLARRGAAEDLGPDELYDGTVTTW